MWQFDVVVIGSGLGGLLSAVMLAKEGMRVAVIEQNKQVGGCLQTFSFEKKIFDSCVHYIGAVDEGQTQQRIFAYAGIMDELKLKRMDNDCFDEIIFGDDPLVYPQAQGADNFIAQLAPFFPGQQQALEQYVRSLKQVGGSFPLYELRTGSESEKDQVSHWEVYETLQRLVPDTKLRNVLTGNNLLYAGIRDRTPFYLHALVCKSYIDSAYKCTGGSSQIAKLLWKQLQAYGGEIFRNEKVTGLVEEQGLLKAAVTASGEVYPARQFIANVHPAMVMSWLDSSYIKPGYRKRLAGIRGSISAFMVNIVLEPGVIPYTNRNTYWNRSGHSFDAVHYKPGEWPANYALYYGEDALRPGFADTVALLTYMHDEELAQWQHTHNRTAATSSREAAYHAFKEERAALLIDTVAQRYPAIKQYLRSFKTASPLTFRDYMGSPGGSIYGMMPDVQHPMQTRVPIRTKIPNLLLAGQNVGMHGVLGVSINAVAASAELLGMDYLLQQINKV